MAETQFKFRKFDSGAHLKKSRFFTVYVYPVTYLQNSSEEVGTIIPREQVVNCSPKSPVRKCLVVQGFLPRYSDPKAYTPPFFRGVYNLPLRDVGCQWGEEYGDKWDPFLFVLVDDAQRCSKLEVQNFSLLFHMANHQSVSGSVLPSCTDVTYLCHFL